MKIAIIGLGYVGLENRECPVLTLESGLIT
jgi:hypothetical protein